MSLLLRAGTPPTVGAQWSEPPRRATLAVALIASQVISFVQPGNVPASDVTGIQYLPLSEPVRVAPRDAWFQPVTVQPLNPVVSFSYYQPLSTPKFLVAQRCADFPAFAIGQPDATDVTGIKYLPLSEPVRVPPRDVWFQPFTWVQPGNKPASDATAIPYLPLSEPVRVPPRTVWFQDRSYVEIAPFPEEVSEDRWHQPWSEPVRVPPRTIWFQPDTLTRTQSDVTGIYYTALSEPVRVPPRAVWFQPDTLTRTQSDVTGIKYPPLAEPIIKSLPRTAWFQPDTIGRPATDVTGIQYPPLSEPVRTPPRAPWFQDRAYVEIAPFPEEVSEDRWHQPWSEPVRVPLRTVQFQDYAANIFPIVGQTILSSQWFAPLTDPVRVAPRTAWFQPDTLVQFSPFAETVTESRWHQPWSEPVRTLPRTVWFQPDTIGRPASDVTGIYYTALSEPVRVPLRDAWYQPETSFAPNPVVSFSYYQPLVDPVRVPPRAVWFQFVPILGQPASDVTGIYYTALSEPVRLPPRTVWFNQHGYTESAPFGEEVSEDRWHQPWSEPVRTRPRAADFPAFFAVPITVVPSFGYYAPLVDPVRVPLRVVWFQPFTYGEPNRVDVLGIRYPQWLEPVRSLPRAVWFQPDTLTRTASDVTGIKYFPLSEPVRVPPRTVWFDPFSTSWASIAPPSFKGWYNWLNEPVRLPLGLKFYLQSTTVIPSQIISARTTGTMSATELGDALLAGIIAFNQVKSAEVGVIDIPPVSGEVGIIEITQVSASVGSVVNVTANESGTPVNTIAAARVSIRTS